MGNSHQYQLYQTNHQVSPRTRRASALIQRASSFEMLFFDSTRDPNIDEKIMSLKIPEIKFEDYGLSAECWEQMKSIQGRRSRSVVDLL